MRRAACGLILLTIFLFGLLTSALAAGTVVEEDAPVADDISVNAYSAILLDMDKGDVLYEYNADEINYPASTTKIMTALLCLEHGDPEDVITVSDVIRDVPENASLGGLEVGEVMTVHQVLQLMLVVSASEATCVVAEYVAGDVDAFVEMMNDKAEELGCTNTHFVNPHGFPNSDHYTTARDLSKIALAAMEYKEFRDIVGAAVTTVEPTNIHGKQTIVSTNGILPGSKYPDYNYPYAIGIKTGHTSSAGFCLASAAEKDGLRLLCVVMGTPSRTSSFAQTISLFDWGYDNYDILNYGRDDVPEPELPAMTDTAEDSVFDQEEPEPTATPAPTPAPEPSASLTPAPSPEAPERQEIATRRFSELDAGSRRLMVMIGGVILAAFLLMVTMIVVLIRRR